MVAITFFGPRSIELRDDINRGSGHRGRDISDIRAEQIDLSPKNYVQQLITLIVTRMRFSNKPPTLRPHDFQSRGFVFFFF